MGASYNWAYALVTLFGLGILYIVFNQVFMVHLNPTMENILNASTIDPTVRSQIISANNKYMAFFHSMPFILFGVVVIFMIVSAVTREREDMYN